MAKKISRELKQIIYPYLFVLKQGDKFKDNILDYQLLMIQLGMIECIYSPHSDQKEKSRFKPYLTIKNSFDLFAQQTTENDSDE